MTNKYKEIHTPIHDIVGQFSLTSLLLHKPRIEGINSWKEILTNYVEELTRII